MRFVIQPFFLLFLLLGFFSKEGALNGLWTSYDIQGNKVSQGYYSNGIKTGQWLFWTGDTLKEVDYVNSRIINVSEWRQKSELALNNEPQKSS